MDKNITWPTDIADSLLHCWSLMHKNHVLYQTVILTETTQQQQIKAHLRLILTSVWAHLQKSVTWHLCEQLLFALHRMRNLFTHVHVNVCVCVCVCVYVCRCGVWWTYTLWLYNYYFWGFNENAFVDLVQHGVLMLVGKRWQLLLVSGHGCFSTILSAPMWCRYSTE